MSDPSKITSPTTPPSTVTRVDKGKKKKKQSDPDGSLGVARGNLTKASLAQRSQALLENRSESELHRIHAHYEGPHAFEAQERRSILQQDDANPLSTQHLSDHQKRALQRRKALTKKEIMFQQGRQVQRLEAAVAAADAQLVLNTENPGLIQLEHDMERTTRLTQQQLKLHHLDEQTARHIYDLNLNPHLAPYGFKYDRSGRTSVLYGERGHVAVMDNHTQSLVTEFHVLQKERLRDACFLHNSSLLAVAQTNHVYIYDDTGAEVHKLNDHIDPFALTYLPHHWLLCSIGRAGWLKYHDTSTGELVSQHRTQQGSSSVLRHNPQNAIVHVGHKNGTVTLWSPSSSTYLVKTLCHKGSPITSLAVFDHTMVTGGSDQQVKIWDMRMYKQLHAYYCKGGIPTSLDLSQRGILGIGHGSHTTFWQDCSVKHQDPYMYHALPGKQVSTLRFRPFEDVCGIGHSHGVSSIVIPGSGEPNLDTGEYHTNPFSDRKQTREAEVRSLLDKLSPHMIALDPDVVATVEATHMKRQRIEQLQEDKVEVAKKKQKSKKRGRSKIQTQLRRKARNVVDEGTIKLREARDAEIQTRKEQADAAAAPKGRATSNDATVASKAPAALQRFFQ